MKAKAPVAMQLKRPGGGKAARNRHKQKNKTHQTVEIVRSWTMPQFVELSKEERDIVLDRLQKEVVDVPSTLSHAVRGVNQVAKAVVRGELRVVVFANNPDSLVFGHLPVLCRLHQVPICVLHLSSKTFGRLFQLKSLAVVGIRALESSESMAIRDNEDAGQEGAVATNTTSAATAVASKIKQLTEAEEKKLASITEFLVSKASKRMM